MDSSPTRRRTLQLGAAGIAAGVAGCLGDDAPEETLDFGGFDRIDDGALPDLTRYATAEKPFPEYRLYRAENPDSVLILLHTAVFDSRLLQPLASALAEANVAHVFTPDLRGHGPDPEQRGNVAARGQLEDDIRSLVDRVENLYPDLTLVVGGHGTGGGVVVRFAATPRRDIVDGFLLLAPYLGRGTSTTRPGMGGWANFYGDRIFLHRVLTGVGIDRYPEMVTVEYEIPDELWDGTETLDHTYRLMASYTPEEDATERMVDRPCLTLVGSDDETAYPEAYPELLGARASTQLEPIEGATYFDLTLTETAVDAIDEWLGSAAF